MVICCIEEAALDSLSAPGAPGSCLLYVIIIIIIIIITNRFSHTS